MTAPHDLAESLSAVVAYLGQGPLKTTVAELEIALEGCVQPDVAQIAADRGVNEGLLRSAVTARNAFAQLDSLIHSTSIALALPHLLESGEELARPSLAAGNTADRLYDVETNVRVAEFKFSRWDGGDGSRRKGVAKDLARLAADKSGRRAELYVLGERPLKWLTTTSSSVRSQIQGNHNVVAAFEANFGSADVPVSDFVAGPASHVKVVNLETRLPHLFGPHLI